METQVTCSARHRYPAEAPPSCGTVESLGTPENWRRTSAATAVLMAALLPTAVVSDMQLRVGIASALLASALLVLASHLAREIAGPTANCGFDATVVPVRHSPSAPRSCCGRALRAA